MADAFFSQKIRTLFNRFDIDKNGELNKDELQQALTKLGGSNFSNEEVRTLVSIKFFNFIYFII